MSGQVIADELLKLARDSFDVSLGLDLKAEGSGIFRAIDDLG